MAVSNAPEESDSRTSSVGRKRGSQQISQNTSAAASPTSESTGASSRASRRSRKRARKNNEKKDEQSVEERSAQDAGAAAAPSEPAAPGVVSWNKGVQATVRTSFGRSPAGALKANTSKAKIDDAATAHANGIDDASPSSVEKKTPKSKKKPKVFPPMVNFKTEQLAKLAADNTLPKPTQKLNVGGEGREIWVKYSLEHNPQPHKCSKSKVQAWIRRELQNRTVPHLMLYNVDILDDLDADKIVEVIGSIIDHQPLYDDHAREEGHKVIDDKAFIGYCRNQLKAARANKKSGRMPSQHEEVSIENSNAFGKLVSSTDVSNAVSDMELGSYTNDDSGSESPDSNFYSSSPKSISHSLGDEASSSVKAGHARSESEESYAPHPVDAVLESRINSGKQDQPRIEVAARSSPRTKAMAPVAGLPQQLHIAQAEVQKYYPGLVNDQPHCLTCREDGHIAAFCPELTCATCGERGLHFTYACPQNIVCSKCREKGHTVADCPEKLARSVGDGVVCEICGSTKHIGDNCHLLWRSYNPDKNQIKKVSSMLVDCYSCGALNHFGTECGLRGTRMPYGGQSWTAENRERYLEGKGAGTKDLTMRSKNGMSIRGMARNEPISISDSEEESFIRPRVVPPPPPPQRTHMKFSDRVTLPAQPPPPRNNNLPSYAQQPPPPPPVRSDWAAVQGNGAYRETFSNRGGMDYADDFRSNDDFHSFNGRDHDDHYRSSGRDEPFRAQNNGNGGGRDPFPARPQRNGPPPPNTNRGGRPPPNAGRGGGGRSRSGPAGGRGRGGGPGGAAGGGGGRRGGRR